MPTVLPPPRRSGTPYRLALVCLGNICRSPMADVVLRAKLAAADLSQAVDVLSAGTGDWHVGKPMDRRAAALLTAHGYDASAHRAQQVDPSWFEDCDVLLAMDQDNQRDLEALAAGAREHTLAEGRLLMFRDFDPRAGAGSGSDRDVPDPYYGGDDGFDRVLAMVERTCGALVVALTTLLGERVT